MKIFDLDSLQEIWATITKNKVRSILTAFGVFWGLFMLTTLIGVGNAFKGGMFEAVGGFAPNSCFFYTDQTSVPYKGYRKGRWWSMNNKDIQLLQEKAKTVDLISPMLFGNRGDKNIVRGHKAGSYGTMGIYPAHMIMQPPDILYGRTFNTLDIKENRKVCVVGKEIYETLFYPGENPSGEYIKVNGIYFQIIGVISTSGSVQIGGNANQTVYLPFTTMQKAFNMGNDIYFLGCTTKPGYPADVMEEEVKSIIKTAHSIAPDDQKAMGSFNTEMIFLMFQMLFAGVDFIIWIVGLGALMSGIIGISNIMLVTVKERTREIGVRRAIGAKPVSIVSQILSESFVLTAIAGFFGLVFGLAVLEFVRNLMIDKVVEIPLFIPPFVSFNTAIAAMLILMVSGILAGLMPALRALRIKAIDAIREE